MTEGMLTPVVLALLFFFLLGVGGLVIQIVLQCLKESERDE